MTPEARLRDYQTRAEAALDRWLPAISVAPTRLHEAMRYVTLGGGKRVRPVLVYATGAALGVAPPQLDGAACAVELIHAYSLVHDDLPAMDNDDLRRGQPTCHKAYDEATAILVGDALQSLAFCVLSTDPALDFDSRVRGSMLAELAVASGSQGMAGGQAIDMAAAGTTPTLADLETMHRLKTGALIRASVRLAALTRPDLTPTLRQQLDTYAECLGLAFQIRDDILDVEGDTQTLGKPQGSDHERNKPTYTSLLGLDGAKRKAREVHLVALDSLGDLGSEAEMLRWLANYVVSRCN